jgi:hypothetical protein
MQKRFFAVLALVAAFVSAANAKCRLPEPDGGEAHPSPPNLRGRIDKVSGSEVLVRQDKTGRIVRVMLPENSDIYTAFGGDGSRRPRARPNGVGMVPRVQVAEGGYANFGLLSHLLQESE